MNIDRFKDGYVFVPEGWDTGSFMAGWNEHWDGSGRRDAKLLDAILDAKREDAKKTESPQR